MKKRDFLKRLRQEAPGKLRAMLKDNEATLAKLREGRSLGKVIKADEFQVARRRIAQILTVLGEHLKKE